MQKCYKIRKQLKRCLIKALGFLYAFEESADWTLLSFVTVIQTCRYLYSSNFTQQVKKARNQSQIFNKKSISRNTTHRQSYHVIQINYISILVVRTGTTMHKCFWIVF